MKKFLIAFVAILLIISSCKLKEDTTGTTNTSSSGTNNTTSSAIKVLKPNGGESIAEGSSYEIDWTGSGIVRIQSSIDNGSTWSLVVDSLKGTGIYSWFPVPNQISNQCRIRVSTVDGTFDDASDQVFSIVRNSNKSLSINSPKKADEWEAGSAKQIKWFSSGIDSVKIDYTTDNGNHWNLITVDKKNTGIYYWEPVPNTPSTLAKVRIMDAKDGVTSAESDLFSILPEQILKVLSPNGGETILAKTSRTIQWKSTNIENVKIAYTTNNGFNWIPIIASTPSLGFYIWNVPDSINSQLCKIRVYDAKDDQPNDVSDSTFTITNQITKTLELQYPIGGEKFRVGFTPTIKWVSSGVKKVNILFTKHNNWDIIDTIASNIDNVGSYDKWTVPDLGYTTSSCKIRVTDISGEPKSDSKSTFTITPTPSLSNIRPNSVSPSWVAGVVDTIRWESVGVENVFLEFTADNGKSWTTIVTKTAANGLNGKYPYSFSSPGTQYRIHAVDADYKYPEATSSGTFTVTPEPKITVTSPNGNEEWYAGSSNNIKWVSTGVTNVKIEYTIDNANWNLITASTPSVGVYSWNPIPQISSLQCRIRVSNAINGIPSDISDDNFSISNPGTQLIKVKIPNGGEAWAAGTSQNITWDAAGVSNVKIEYTSNNGDSWNTIIASTPNTGFYAWSQIPSTPSTICKVRISDASDGAPSVTSDAFFTIGPPASIKIVVPNGNDTWLTGSTKEIKWTAENVVNVKIEYTSNAGGTWNTIASSYPNTGSYSWVNIPDANNSLNCRIRISEAIYGSPSAISADNFAIMRSGAQQLKIVSPVGGEKWNVGTMQNIIWDAGGIANVKIEYTTNNGGNWTTLTSSSPSNGYYTWNPIPNTVATNCKVKISDAADGDPYSISNNSFSILPTPSIKVLSPNGGETILYGAPTEIQYLAENIAKVKIEYTTNGGAAWNVITDSTISIGNYSWTSVPNTNSTLCKIRVSDASNGTSSDISDNNFSISNIVKKSVKILSPNGGEIWEAGTTQNITWNSSAIAFFKVEFSTDKGSTWTTLKDNYQGGAFQWNLSSTLNSTQCQIRVSDASDNTISDISDGTFTIAPRKYIKVLTPVGPAIYKDSDTIRISWESSGIQYVGIKYTTTNGTGHYPDTPQFYDLVTKIANTGSYTTSFSFPSDQYYVVVYDAAEGANQSPSARSTGSFSVVKTNAQKITVTSPIGGEQWLSYTSPLDPNRYEIKWQANNVENVKIEYSINGGFSWNNPPIVASTANDGSYFWTPSAADSSDNCLIRISDVANSSLNGVSSSFFSLRQSKMIRVDFPSDQTVYFEPSNSNRYPMDIRWTSYAVSNVDIYFSLDNGVTWFTIAADAQNQSSLNYPSTGAYEWTYPTDPLTGPFSTLGRVKIIDHSDPKIWDTNDIPFWLNKREGQGK